MASCAPSDDDAVSPSSEDAATAIEQSNRTASSPVVEPTECPKTTQERKVIDDCIQALVDSEEQSNPGELSVDQVREVLRPAPYFVNGKLVGYRVYPGGNPKLFESLGLQVGDLVTEIDGQSLDDPAHVFGQFQQLASRQATQVKVERSGQLKVIEIQAE